MMSFMDYLLCILPLISLVSSDLPPIAQSKYDSNSMQCLVCKATIREFLELVKLIDPSGIVEVGGYRLDPEGKFMKKIVPKAKSEIHLSEVLEKSCEAIDNYLKAKWKRNNKLTIIKMVLAGVTMNPHMSEVEFFQDDDLNRSLKYYCEEVLEAHEDDIIKHYLSKGSIDVDFCDEAKICTDDMEVEEESFHVDPPKKKDHNQEL